MLQATTTSTTTPGPFPWESAVPTGPFFASIPNPNFGRQFLRVFTAADITTLGLDAPANVALPTTAKLALLEHLVLDRMAADPLGPPETLSHADFEHRWHRREFLLAHLQRDLGDPEKSVEAERRLRRMIAVWAARDDPEKKWPADLGAVDNLGITLMNEGRYAEAEAEFKGLIDLIRAAPDLGYGSPMNVGIMRKVMEVLGKQGKFEEARELNREGYVALEALRRSRFKKYEAELRTALDETRDKLEWWQGIPFEERVCTRW